MFSLQGKVKSMVENPGSVALDPTPNLDAHVSKSFNFDLNTTPSEQAYKSSQVRTGRALTPPHVMDGLTAAICLQERWNVLQWNMVALYRFHCSNDSAERKDYTEMISLVVDIVHSWKVPSLHISLGVLVRVWWRLWHREAAATGVSLCCCDLCLQWAHPGHQAQD